MATTEPEILTTVSLCDADGRRLNSQARGWSRIPLHDANLQGSWGRNKKWDYWAILADEFAISVTYADVDYLGIAAVWWADLSTGEVGGIDNTVPFARGFALPDRFGTTPLRYEASSRSGRSMISVTDDAHGTVIEASWIERDGRAGRLEARIELPDGHESLNVVIPWSDKRFQYTSKHQARPASGVLEVGDDRWEFGVPDRDAGKAWGVLDVGRGRWPYRNRWNWAGGAGHSDHGSVVGLQFGGKWTEGTGFTENGVIVDGRLSKIGAELDWIYDWEQPMKPWTVHGVDGCVNVVLTPVLDRHSKVNAGVLSMEVHQVFGRWTGSVTDDDGVVHRLDGIVGFAEEARNRW